MMMDESNRNTSKNCKAFYDEFNNESPRGVVIISAVFIDKQLQNLLENHLKQDKSVIRNLFNNNINGPLSSLSAKIKTSYVLGLIPKEIYNDLEIIRQIRNKFAHEIFGMSFQNEEIVKLSTALFSGKIPYDHITDTTENRFRIYATILINKIELEIIKSDRKKFNKREE